MLPKFDPEIVLKHLLHETDSNRKVNVFMAVPTIYAKLLEVLRNQEARREEIIEKLQKNIRLMVSGSAALPQVRLNFLIFVSLDFTIIFFLQPIFEEWKSRTGHTLLERYGMTEIGMGLTNPLSGPRLPGFVGKSDILFSFAINILYSLCF